ncbi:MAG: outer membrane protein OmpA-like peptidoglycan-associated protein [Myxococcota bacterium]|jgi:outer membrane protein OmpA-like peptidoglycan-associated protein
MFTLFLVTAAMAQDAPTVPELNSQLYRAPMDSRQTLWTDVSGGIVDDPRGEGRAVMHYVNRPFVWVPDPGVGAEGARLVSDALQLDAIGAVHVDRFRIGVVVPIYLFTAGQLTNNGAGLGDIALDARATFLDKATAPFGLGASLKLALPTASVEAPLGSSQAMFDASLLVDDQFGPVLVAANLGTRLGPPSALENVDLNDQFLYRVGSGYAVSDGGGLSLDLAGQFSYSAPLANPAGAPLEALVGGWARVSDTLVFRGGLGRGLTPGIGSPVARVVTMLALEPRDVPDTDGDGYVDTEDGCPLQPEDFDGYRDEDGCPDPSQVVRVEVQDPGGTVIDSADVFLTGEDLAEENDSDFTTELHAGPYRVVGNAEGFKEGRVDFSVPLEGLPTVVVTLQPEVVLGSLVVLVQSEGGVPVDTSRWNIDAAPGPTMDRGIGRIDLPAGQHVVSVSADGYAPVRLDLNVVEGATREEIVVLAPTRVVVTEQQIELKESIFFETAKAVIKEVSFPLLDEVATILLDHPEIEVLRVEGHTDSRGSASYNKTLSEARAASVRQYLVGNGVEPGRVRSVGYGEEKPLDAGNNAAAWEKNRRVDMFIEKKAK